MFPPFQQRWWRAMALGLVFALAVAADSLSLARPQIKIPVWLVSQAGGSFNAKDLSAKLAGSSSRILDVKGPGDDLMILLVLDLTGDLSLVELARTALISEIQKLPAYGTVGLLRAQDGLSVLLDPTSDHEALARAIQDLPISGKPGLLDTVDLSERIADSILAKTYVRVAVLYVTDSDVYQYREDLTNPVINTNDHGDLSRRFPQALVREKISKLKARFSGAQAPLFMVHLQYRTDRVNQAYQGGLKELAEITAGTAVFCKSNGEVQDAIQKLFELISSYYSVTVAVPADATKNIEVQLEADGSARIQSYRTRFVLR